MQSQGAEIERWANRSPDEPASTHDICHENGVLGETHIKKDVNLRGFALDLELTEHTHLFSHSTFCIQLPLLGCIAETRFKPKLRQDSDNKSSKWKASSQSATVMAPDRDFKL